MLFSPKLAFGLFGLHLTAKNRLTATVVLFILALVERRDDAKGPLILLTVAGLIYAACYYSDFLTTPIQSGMGNNVNARFMLVLGVVPAIDLIVMMVARSNPTVLRAAAVLVQAFAIFLAVHVRATGILRTRCTARRAVGSHVPWRQFNTRCSFHPSYAEKYAALSQIQDARRHA